LHQLFIDFKKFMIQLGGRSCTKFGVHLENGKANKNVSECNPQQNLGTKHLSDKFPTRNG